MEPSAPVAVRDSSLVRAKNGSPVRADNKRYMRVASASQLMIEELCTRKWAFSYPFNMKAKRTKAHEFGEMIHKQLELYTKQGLYPNHPLAQVALPYIPKYGTPGVTGELEDSLLTSAVPTRVKIDLTDISEIGVVRITDYKTTKSREYIPTPEKLLENTQAIIYSYWAWMKYRVPVLTRFLYLLKSGPPRAISVDIAPTGAYLEEQWALRLPQIERMQADYIFPRPEDFAGEPDAPDHPSCQAFGGCPFRELCALLEGGRKRFFAGIGSITPKPVVNLMENQQHQEIRTLFPRLHPSDRVRILKGVAAKNLEDLIASPNHDFALNAMRTWVDCPTPEDLAEKAEKCSYDLPLPAVSLHPNQRKEHWDLMPSGVINPPDGTPNHTPKPPDPKLMPVTAIPGIGEVVAERMATALGLGPTETPTVAQVAAKGIEFHKPVTGLSRNKMKEIIQMAGPEVIEKEEKKQEAAQKEIEGLLPAAPEAPATTPPATTPEPAKPPMTPNEAIAREIAAGTNQAENLSAGALERLDREAANPGQPQGPVQTTEHELVQENLDFSMGAETPSVLDKMKEDPALVEKLEETLEPEKAKNQHEGLRKARVLPEEPWGPSFFEGVSEAEIHTSVAYYPGQPGYPPVELRLYHGSEGAPSDPAWVTLASILWKVVTAGAFGKAVSTDRRRKTFVRVFTELFDID